ncbi:MAG: flippase [Nanoarchaeota archaeon]
MKPRTRKAFDTNLRIVVKTSFIVFVGIILSKVFSYLYRILIARTFGPEEYGLFSLAVMILGWFVAFASLGLPEGVLRYTALFRGKKELEKIRFVYQFSRILLMGTSILFGVVLFFLAEPLSLNMFHAPALVLYLRIFSFLVPLTVLSSFYLATLRAYEKIGWYSFIINIFQTGMRFILLLFLIVMGLKTQSISFSYAVGAVSVLLISYLTVRHFLKEIKDKSKLTQDKKREVRYEIISYSWPILFLSTVANILYWTDTFFLGIFKGVADVGYYNAAIPLALLLGFVPDLFMQLFFPLITRKYSKKNHELISELSKQIGKWIFLLNVPLLLFMVVFPGAIINLFFGADYLVAENALRLLAIGAFFLSMIAVSNNLLSMIGKSRLILVNTLLGFFANVILDIMLIPAYGLTGAAFATMLANMLIAALYFMQAKKYTSIIPLRRSMIKIFLISLITIVVLLTIRAQVALTSVMLIALCVFSVVFYVTLILLTKCLDSYDWIILNSVRKKILQKFSIV